MFNPKSSASAIITGTGWYVPEKILTNDDLSKMVDTSDEWIRPRTGIAERHIAAADQPTSFLAAQAGKKALENAGVKPEEIDLLVVATISPDQLLPSTACLVQPQLGLVNATSFDIVAACSGFVYVLDVARQYILSGAAKKALVIGAEKMSSIIDWQDRSTCVLFGDGAGAVVLERLEEPNKGILATNTHSDGSMASMLRIEVGGSKEPLTPENIGERRQFVKMEGNVTFQHAVRNMSEACLKALEDAGLQIADVNWVIPHQANQRIIDAVGKKIGVSPDKVITNIGKYGNTTAASIPLAMAEANEDGRIKEGDIVLIVAFGAGLTWGASVIRWGK